MIFSLESDLCRGITFAIFRVSGNISFIIAARPECGYCHVNKEILDKVNLNDRPSNLLNVRRSEKEYLVLLTFERSFDRCCFIRNELMTLINLILPLPLSRIVKLFQTPSLPFWWHNLLIKALSKFNLVLSLMNNISINGKDVVWTFII